MNEVSDEVGSAGAREQVHTRIGEDVAQSASRIAHARSLLVRVLAGRATLHRVAIALGIAVDRLPADRAGRGLAVFRAYVGATVRTVSPLAVRTCELNGLSLDELALNLRPGMFWYQWLCGVCPSDAWQRALSGSVNAGVASTELRNEWRLQEWLHSGWPVYHETTPDLLFGLRVLESGLEMAAFPGGHRLRTHGSEGSITLTKKLPDTVMAALPGRPLDHLIDHPLINGVGCVVTAVDEPNLRRGMKVRFALKPTPWRMPWAR